MAKKTVQQIRESVLSYGFSSQNYAAAINDWIDEAQRVMFRKAGLRTKQTEFEYKTTAGDNSYELPSNFGNLVSIRNKTAVPSQNLSQIFDIKEFDELEAEQGEPTNFIVSGNEILVYPTPNKEISLAIRYSIIPSQIAEESSANPSVAEDFIHLIEIYCLYKAFGKEQDIEMSNYYKGIFDREMVDFVGEMNTDTRIDDEQIQGGWGLGYPC